VPVVTVALLMVSLAAGWILGVRGVEGRKTLALTTSLCNVGVGLVIATDAFGGTPAVTAVLAYGLVGVFDRMVLGTGAGCSVAVKQEIKEGRLRAGAIPADEELMIALHTRQALSG